MEIADKIAFQSFVFAPVERTNAMHDVWDRVCDMILSELDLRGCRIMECYRSGCLNNATKNQITITMTVDRDSARKWIPFREGVVKILKWFGLIGVIVRITTGRVIRAGDYLNRELPDNIWNCTAKLGARMGLNSRPNGRAAGEPLDEAASKTQRRSLAPGEKLVLYQD